MSKPRFVRSVASATFIITGVLGASACTPKPPPTSPTAFAVNGITPNLGSTLGPTRVMITGSGFTSGARITADGVETPASVTSAFGMTAMLPAHAPGRVEVVVTNGGGETASVPTGFTYVAASPITITGLDPDRVAGTGGPITISGSGFLVGVVVTVAGAVVPTTLMGSSRLVVTAPAHTPGVVDVVVTNPFSEPVMLSGALTYQPLPAVQIDHVTPAIGSSAGGTLLAIFGQSFRNGARVTIDGQMVTAELGDFEALYIDTPAHAPGPVDIVVTNPDGQSHRLSAGFTYAPPNAFSFTGRWDAYVRPAWVGGPGFRVEHDTVTGFWCGSEAVNLVPAALPVVNDGAFSFNAVGGGQISGHVVTDGEAAGTVSIPGCASGTWYAYRR